MNPLETRYLRAEITRGSPCSVTPARSRGWKLRPKLLRDCMPPPKNRARGFPAHRLWAILSGLYHSPLPPPVRPSPDALRGQRGAGGAPRARRGGPTRGGVAPHGGRARGAAAELRPAAAGSASPAAPQHLPLPGSPSGGRGGGGAGGRRGSRGGRLSPRARRVGTGPRHSPTIAPPHRGRAGVEGGITAGGGGGLRRRGLMY